MTRTLATTVAAALLFAAPALPQDKQADAPKKEAVQQQRMKTCNDQAGKKDLKGRERQAFMSRCLKGRA